MLKQSELGSSTFGSDLDEDKSKLEESPLPYKKFHLDEIDVSNIEVTSFFENGQGPTTFINYGSNSDKLFIKCKKINLVQGGIPRLSNEGYNQHIMSDNDRKYMKIPIDPSQPALVELGKFLEKLDEKFGSKEMRIKLFGKKDRYTYSPIKVSQNYDEEDEDEEIMP